MEDFPYDSPCDPHSVATAFRTENKSRVCLAKKQNQAGVDAIGVHGDMMTLLQCTYPEMDSTAQEWKEVEQFMNFTEKTGVNSANSAGCNQIRAIFATGRAPRDYTSRRPTELEVDGVHISNTVMRRPRTEEAVQSGRCRSVLGSLPASCASDRAALTVDQTPRRGQMQFNELQAHRRKTGCAVFSA